MSFWVFIWLGLQASQVLAATSTSGGGIQIANPLGCAQVTDCIQSILNGLIYLAAPIVAIMVLVGGFQIMASGGNEEKLKTGKNTILYAVIGYAIILLASGVAAVINDVISGGSGGPGNPPPSNPPGSSCTLSCPAGKICSLNAAGQPTCIANPFIPPPPTSCNLNCNAGQHCVVDPVLGPTCMF